MKSTIHWKQIGAVVATGMLLRLAVIGYVITHFPAGWFFHRGMEMGSLAQSLLEGKGLSSPFGVPTGPSAFIAPGYPIFVAAVFRIFGSYSMASAIIIMAIHVLANLLTLALLMLLAQKLTNQRTALLAGIFWAVSLPLLWMPTIFWETNLSACWMIGGLATALWLGSRPAIWLFAISGIGLGFVGLTNPAMLPAMVAMLLWAAYESRRTCRYGLPIALLAFLLVFSAWPIRNARVFHAFIPLRSTVGFEMWMGNHPGSNGYLDETLFPTFNAKELNQYISKGEVAYVREKSGEARAYIRSNPARFFSLSTDRLWRFWTGSGTRGGSGIFVLHGCLTTIPGLTGLILMYRRQRRIAVLALLPLLLFPVPYYLTHAEFRYRLVIDPVLTLFAAFAVTELAGRLTGKGTTTAEAARVTAEAVVHSA